MIQSLLESFSTLLFPPLCFHCNCELPHAKYPFCETCVTLFERSHPKECCHRCHGPLAGHGTHCPSWTKPYLKVIRCFEKIGPPKILKELHQTEFYPDTAELIANLLLIEIERRNIPPPVQLVALPRSADQEVTKSLQRKIHFSDNQKEVTWVIASQIEPKKHLAFGKHLLREKRSRLILISLT